MASVNKFIGIGNLTKDPETRFLPNGDAVTNITIACNETWKDRNGEKQERVEFVRVTFYRKLAEIVGQYLRKGSSVYIDGRLETRKWTDKQGIDRYSTDIIANEMKMLGGKSDAGYGDTGGKPVSGQDSKPANNNSGFDDMDDDIPF